MSSTSAATTPPASVQLPSGNTSDEGDTAGTDGQGGQATSSPGAAGLRDATSFGGKDSSKEDVGEKPSVVDSPRSDAPRDLRSDGAVSSRQTCVIGSSNSVGTQTADTMVTRFLTEPEVRRLETDISLPAPELGPRGDVASQSHSLLEQLARLVAAEHARVQWDRCATDEERIGHLPANIRDMLTPAYNRDLNSDTL
ncbi:hypothetical protein PF002_g28658 [Phytophthora fragariae]|uniref:Uncharacterized protein n=1 Tax=Phytophthora fragariae TaxID=53985 RepID=A0A6A3W9W0_9STRA|nr:hypothetical protein PF011_g27260 [Phytophthora fragariae]KAE9175933.1 hypothetical protein PF002_g28658 [Phytophthora fragariae]KAE9180623.1 hypothetical protein PF004_g24785 [Phytophthora fragariae]